jgi:hypothetical protein
MVHVLILQATSYPSGALRAGRRVRVSSVVYRKDLNDPHTSEAVKIIKDDHAGSAGVPACPFESKACVGNAGRRGRLRSQHDDGSDYFHSLCRLGDFRFCARAQHAVLESPTAFRS